MNNVNFEISFSELRCKEVVNACDGRKLGKITDIIFSNETGKIKGIVTPYAKRSLLSKGQDVFIPWRCVRKLGEDVIIVDVSGAEDRNDCFLPPPDCDCSPKCDPPPCKQDMPSCDRRCEKCMLFDCEYRWKS